MNKQGFQYQFPQVHWRGYKACLCRLWYWLWPSVYFMPLWTCRLRCRESVWYHSTQIWGLDPTAQQPSGHCGINLCLLENRIDLQVLSKQPSLPASDWEKRSNNTTWTTSDMSAKGPPLWTTKAKLTLNLRHKQFSFWGYIPVLPVIPKYIYFLNTIHYSTTKCNESSEDICLSKIC